MEQIKSNTQKPYGTVLIKAKDILDFLMKSQDPPSLAEMSEGLSSSKPTILKILNTLDLIGFVRRDEQTKRYYLGTELIPYAQKALDSFDIAKVARPFLETLRDETGETINLGVVRNDKIVLVEKLESPNSIKLQSIIGDTMNMYSSAMGKALLANYSTKHLDTYFETHKLKPLTPNTITSLPKLKQNLRTIQEMGVSIDNEENQPEVLCLGAPLIKNGRIYGAFSISSPKYRVTKDRQSNFIRLLLNTQHAIEKTL
ncbi:IclR family transcriptional regulator [Lacticaseibacillus rhamnosus]|uniref:IclR family transcriptional regulator n=1 Tax=Lacticaseibacillus rhamnosus TaxID=47715 RepID=UPI0009BBEE66|nr:IclR family transcriptional regulator [Lacticaseibacillus rhamnosus]